MSFFVKAMLPEIVPEGDGFGVDVEVTGPPSSINNGHTVVRMRDNTKVPIAPFANGDNYKIRVCNNTKLPLYVLFGLADKVYKAGIIINPGSHGSIDSEKEGGEVFEILTREQSRNAVVAGASAVFKKDEDLHRVVFIGAKSSFISQKDPKDYRWVESEDSLQIPSYKKKKKKITSNYFDDSLGQVPLAKTIAGKKLSKMKYYPRAYKDVAEKNPLLSKAFRDEEIQITEFQWRSGDLAYPRNANNYECKALPEIYQQTVTFIKNKFCGAIREIEWRKEITGPESKASLTASEHEGAVSYSVGYEYNELLKRCYNPSSHE